MDLLYQPGRASLREMGMGPAVHTSGKAEERAARLSAVAECGSSAAEQAEKNGDAIESETRHDVGAALQLAETKLAEEEEELQACRRPEYAERDEGRSHLQTP